MDFLPLRHDDVNVYAGMWKRLLASLIDGVLLLPIGFPLYYLQSYSMNAALITGIFSSFTFVVYSIYFHYKFGATLGKWILGIRVTLPNGHRIGLRHAILRSSIDSVFAILGVICHISAISLANPEIYLNAGWIERIEHLISLSPNWYQAMQLTMQLWFWSQFLVVLLNKRKRAIHDFIAGTVVIKKEFVEQF